MKNISLLRKNIIFAILILSASLVSCNGKKYNLPKETLVITKADGTNVEVKAELATKDEERQYGFMNRKVIPDGHVATYIPQLGTVDPNLLGITMVTKDGDVYSAGDCDTRFTIQSISKTISLIMALIIIASMLLTKKLDKNTQED